MARRATRATSSPRHLLAQAEGCPRLHFQSPRCAEPSGVEQGAGHLHAQAGGAAALSASWATLQARRRPRSRCVCVYMCVCACMLCVCTKGTYWLSQVVLLDTYLSSQICLELHRCAASWQQQSRSKPIDSRCAALNSECNGQRGLLPLSRCRCCRCPRAPNAQGIMMQYAYERGVASPHVFVGSSPGAVAFGHLVRRFC